MIVSDSQKHPASRRRLCKTLLPLHSPSLARYEPPNLAAADFEAKLSRAKDGHHFPHTRRLRIRL